MKKNKIIAVLPAYNAAHSLPSFLKLLPKDIFDEVILVDDCSFDGTYEVAKRQKNIKIYRNLRNLGYGGNLKRCLRIALNHRAEVIIEIHPDGEYRTDGIIPALFEIKKGADFVLGNRFSKGINVLEGGMYLWKYISIRLLNKVHNFILNSDIADLHQGFRVYTKKQLKKIDFGSNSDDYTFSFEIILQTLQKKLKIASVPVSTDYHGSKRGADLKHSVVYSLKTFICLGKFIFKGFKSRRKREVKFKSFNDLEKMNNELVEIPQIYYPSPFWQKLNKIHQQQLSLEGFKNFKRTVNVRYFNWRLHGILRHQTQIVFSQLKSGNFHPLFNSKTYGHQGNILYAFFYRIYVSFLYDFVRQQDSLNILDKLEEPLPGNPLAIRYRGKIISQDLSNSVHEFYSIISHCRQKNPKIAELGAGYGRLAYVFLNVLPGCSYTIIDLPPALFLAQEYLAKLFKGEKIFHFRPFDDFRIVEQEFNSSRIKFLMPHQIENLPKNSFDIVISVSTLHEMTRSQIANYLKQIDRLCRGYFYTKQLYQSRARDNEYIKEHEYPIPKNFKNIYHHQHPIQKMFFEALYEIKKTS